MAKVVRYFHIRNGVKGGATVRVSGDTDNSKEVEVQFSRCSKDDNFCKKTGRSLAEKAPIKVLPLRYLPAELDRIAVAAKLPPYYSADFAIKYFLPKE